MIYVPWKQIHVQCPIPRTQRHFQSNLRISITKYNYVHIICFLSNFAANEEDPGKKAIDVLAGIISDCFYSSQAKKKI